MIEIKTNIEAVVLHKVGNKHHEEPIVFSSNVLNADEDLKEILSIYFLSHFKSDEEYRFHHDAEIELNETYHYVTAISKTLIRSLNSRKTLPGIFIIRVFIQILRDCFEIIIKIC